MSEDWRSKESLWWRFRERQMSLWPLVHRKLGRIPPLRCRTTTIHMGRVVRCELLRLHPRVSHGARRSGLILFWDGSGVEDIPEPKGAE